MPVEALYDPDAAHETALRNLLQRRGYADLDAVRKEGREEGREEGELGLVLRLLERALGQISPDDRQRISRLDNENLTLLAEASRDFREPWDLSAWLEHNA